MNNESALHYNELPLKSFSEQWCFENLKFYKECMVALAPFSPKNLSPVLDG